MHKEWCGQACDGCVKPCWVDESMPCSPDCENLGLDGLPIDIEACLRDGCDAYESIEAYLESISEEENENAAST